MLAQIEVLRGHMHAAREIAEAALVLARASSNRDQEVEISALLATADMVEGHRGEAGRRLKREIELLARAGHRSGENDIVVGIAANPLGQRHGCNHFT